MLSHHHSEINSIDNALIENLYLHFKLHVSPSDVIYFINFAIFHLQTGPVLR